MSKTDRDRKPVIETGDWNPRFITYAWDQGNLSPELKLSEDRLLYPGGVMTGFMLWISANWRRWKDEFKIDPLTQKPIKERDLILSEQDHADFTSWLQKRYGR